MCLCGCVATQVYDPGDSAAGLELDWDFTGKTTGRVTGTSLSQTRRRSDVRMLDSLIMTVQLSIRKLLQEEGCPVRVPSHGKIPPLWMHVSSVCAGSTPPVNRRSRLQLTLHSHSRGVTDRNRARNPSSSLYPRRCGAPVDLDQWSNFSKS